MFLRLSVLPATNRHVFLRMVREVEMSREGLTAGLIINDEGLTLETSVFESFTVANLPYRPCG